MAIKLWKNNLLKNEYEMEISDIIKGFIKSEYFVYFNVGRYLPVYIMLDLQSAFDVNDWDELENEYYNQKGLFKE